MHTSGFVALAVLILAIAAAILAITMSDARRDTTSPPAISLGR